ncbi:hypothetical protein F503_03683 [Ophiostoma piceae UAMH 11346]|uniref:Uncharacterized protein n=1 Tax=Ophiostoma piceae (strain UAMH 11346) TaxID=1262450 RepID=S3CFJ1_OPHP1|nr:hypothetical protein F503_03683 [Ophiostoma piceae UAMH 11346]
MEMTEWHWSVGLECGQRTAANGSSWSLPPPAATQLAQRTASYALERPPSNQAPPTNSGRPNRFSARPFVALSRGLLIAVSPYPLIGGPPTAQHSATQRNGPLLQHTCARVPN